MKGRYKNVRRPFPHLMRSILFLTAVALLSATPLRAGNLPENHPTVDLVKKYFGFVIDQNWKEAAAMIRPSSIERKKRETVAIIKSAPTMSEEAAMLAKLGVKDIKDLEKMTAEEFYVADRESFHSTTNTPEVLKQKKQSLKINVLGVVGEQNDTIAHLVVRTSQEVLDQRINELFFISFVQDEKDSKKWLIAPDMQRPVTEPLSPETGEKKDAAPAAPTGDAAKK